MNCDKDKVLAVELFVSTACYEMDEPESLEHSKYLQWVHFENVLATTFRRPFAKLSTLSLVGV